MWQPGPPTYSYRLTATVETPEGERQGHSVIAVWWRGANKIFGSQASAGFTVRGEAVAVDLPNGQTMFVVLGTPDFQDWAAYQHDNVSVSVAEGEDMSHVWPRIAADRHVYPVARRTLIGTPLEMNNYPMFVRFRNIADPRTVEEVNPDDLAASFGPGYRLKSLTVQMTDEPVTTGIEKRLPWLISQGVLIEHPPKMPISERPTVERLNSRNFLKR